MSCIAGPRQFGNEDQGWVAHFLYSVLQGRAITVFGDGFQVRDILHVADLIDAMLLACDHREAIRGEVFNLGGGLARAASVIDMLRECERRSGESLHLAYTEVRPGDQPLYISNTSKLELMAGWKPSRSLDDILQSIEGFWRENHAVIAEQTSPAASAFAPAYEEVA